MDWKEVFVRGVAPSLPTSGLRALADALRGDDPRLVQGALTVPPPLMVTQSFPVEAAQPVAFVGAVAAGGFVCTAAEYAAKGLGASPQTNRGPATVETVEQFFCRVVADANDAVGEDGCRHFLRWLDDTPRAEMRRDLLAEVEAVLSARGAKAA